jgi:hypothetical protein
MIAASTSFSAKGFSEKWKSWPGELSNRSSLTALKQTSAEKM